MGNFDCWYPSIKGLVVIEPRLYGDERGHFMETYRSTDYANFGIQDVFVQENQSKSRKNVLRGLHFQRRYPQAKLVRVLRGTVFDVVVDMREGSATFGSWYGVTLSGKNRKQLYIPGGFAHGFLVLTAEAQLAYKCGEYYHADDEGGVCWDDPDIGIQWPVSDPKSVILSDKDRQWPLLKNVQR